ncbi:hypothetical protein, partial [Nocardia cyriacigeorgica]|uniref:hypothetical protein n=1 Tax=Nocardia cyriacigeorgica TaxID=135487 RepID=UPI0024549FA2
MCGAGGRGGGGGGRGGGGGGGGGGCGGGGGVGLWGGGRRLWACWAGRESMGATTFLSMKRRRAVAVGEAR